MGELKGKVQNALDEARTLILGSQILLGFQYDSIFQRGFDELPDDGQVGATAPAGLGELDRRSHHRLDHACHVVGRRPAGRRCDRTARG